MVIIGKFVIFAAKKEVEMDKVGLSLCVQGTAEKIINGKRILVQRGMLHVISPIIKALTMQRSDDYQTLVIKEDPAHLMNLVYPYLSHLAGQNIPVYPIVQLQEEQYQHYKNILERIIQQEATASALAPSLQKQAMEQMVLLQKQSLLMEFITLILSNQLTNEAKSVTHKEMVVMRFLKAFADNPSQRQVSHYAQLENMSQRHFSAIISETIGITPIRLITLITINSAKYLLHQPDMRVKQVAEKLGFPEQFTFRKYFKTHTGMSPTEYMAQCR